MINWGNGWILSQLQSEHGSEGEKQRKWRRQCNPSNSAIDCIDVSAELCEDWTPALGDD